MGTKNNVTSSKEAIRQSPEINACFWAFQALKDAKGKSDRSCKKGKIFWINK